MVDPLKVHDLQTSKIWATNIITPEIERMQCVNGIKLIVITTHAELFKI